MSAGYQSPRAGRLTSANLGRSFPRKWECCWDDCTELRVASECWRYGLNGRQVGPFCSEEHAQAHIDRYNALTRRSK